MVAVYLLYGLAFFSLGLVVLLERRKASELPLGRQLIWLAIFGLLHAVVEWSDLLLLTGVDEPYRNVLIITRTALLPISALFLIRFGVGLILDTGPVPRWAIFIPVFLITPVALLTAYALISAALDPVIATDVWSRYLLYFTGSVLAGIGFLRQRHVLLKAELEPARNLLLGAAIAFFFNAILAGLIVPRAPYGTALWLNYQSVYNLTGVPVQFWRMLAAVSVTIFVIRALDIFEAERILNMQRLQTERENAIDTLRESEARFRTIFEKAPIGLATIGSDGRAIQVNHIWQQLLGYTEQQLTEMSFVEYTYPDDRQASVDLVNEVLNGNRDFFHQEKRYIRQGGALIWANTNVSALRDPSGEFQYFLVMVEDVTEQRLAEAALLREKERVQETELRAQTEATQVAESWRRTLVDISQKIATMESLDEVLLNVVQATERLMDSDTASIGLLDDAGSVIEMKYHSCVNRATVLNPRLKIENDSLLSLLMSGHAQRFPKDVGSNLVDWHCPTLSQQIKTAAVVPLLFDDRLIGGLWACRFRDNSFVQSELDGLKSLADQIVIALQHALMAARMQSLAVMEERSRIAREMHDGLSQVLGYLGLQAQTLEVFAREGQTEKLILELSKTRENITLAQADIRENILSLRTTLSAEVGLIPALEEYVAEFGAQTGTKTLLVNEVEGTPGLSPLAEVQLVRIVQEALANIRKHAQAENATVNLAENNGIICVTVIDDGIGFEPASGRAQFGLLTMKERAVSVGGHLSVESLVGMGTRVELSLPLVIE